MKTPSTSSHRKAAKRNQSVRDNIKPQLSKIDKAVSATVQQFDSIFNETHAVRDFIGELAIETKNWGSSKGPSKRDMNKLSSSLNMCESVLNSSSNHMLKAAQVTAPLPRMLPLYRRTFLSKFRDEPNNDMKGIKKYKSTSQLAVEKAFADVKRLGNSVSILSKKRQSSRLTMKRHTKGQQTYEYEDPSNREMYNPREVWTVLHDAVRVHGAKAKRVIMNDLIRKGKVGVKGEKALYNIYQKKCVEECPLNWNAKGRPRYISPDKLNQIVSEKADGSTVTFGKRDLTEIVNEGKRERASALYL